MPEIRLRRHVRLVYRKAGERSHASAAFLSLVDDRRGERSGRSDRSEASHS
jgi:hypothetical protein